jgi:AcrR family transcriptional regulator
MSIMKRDQDDKREHILAAARECFLLYGFKRTAMDDIARAADVSRAALYLSFPNKEAMFRTLSEQVHDETLALARIALEGEGSIEQRLVAAFEGKTLLLLGLVKSGAHGNELVDLNHGLGADIAQRTQQAFEELIVQALQEAASRHEISLERVRLDAPQCAELLIRATHGLKCEPLDLTRFRQQLAQLVRVFCAALAPEAVS